MLRTLIISPARELTQKLGESLVELGSAVHVTRILDRYLPSEELARTLRAHAPDVVFLSFEDVVKAVETVRYFEAHIPGLQTIAMNRACDADLLRESMRAGVREFITEPFENQPLVEALRRVKQSLEKKAPRYECTERIFSFVPSKAGVGTSTLAMNIGAAFARGQEGSVLLADLDLNSGLLHFLLRLSNERSLVDAVGTAHEMDETLWPKMISAKNGMDILHAGRANPNLRVEPQQIQNLVQFARRNYRTLVFDHSGNLERYSLEVMQESRKVFMVCTPEIPSLHLAREKMTFLKTLGLDAKVSVLLNRVGKRPLFTHAQVEELVGAPVAHSFSNDYFSVSRAMGAGQCLDVNSTIGKQCAEFASSLGARRLPNQERRKKFLEFFSVGKQEAVLAE